MSKSKDIRLLNQADRALAQISEWLRDLDTVTIDGRVLDDIGEAIHAVEEARAEVETA